MWSVAKDMNFGLWSNWIWEVVDASCYTHFAEECLITHVAGAGPDKPPTLLNHCDDLTHDF